MADWHLSPARFPIIAGGCGVPRIGFVVVSLMVLTVTAPTAAQQTWYWCDPARAYYPEVLTCTAPWRPVTQTLQQSPTIGPPDSLQKSRKSFGFTEWYSLERQCDRPELYSQKTIDALNAKIGRSDGPSARVVGFEGQMLPKYGYSGAPDLYVSCHSTLILADGRHESGRMDLDWQPLSVTWTSERAAKEAAERQERELEYSRRTREQQKALECAKWWAEYNKCKENWLSIMDKEVAKWRARGDDEYQIRTLLRYQPSAEAQCYNYMDLMWQMGCPE